MEFKDEIKIYTRGNDVVGYVECRDSRYGKFVDKKYKSADNAMRYMKFDRDLCEVYDLGKMAEWKRKRQLETPQIAYIMSASTTLKERMINVYTPVLLGLAICGLTKKLRVRMTLCGMYRHEQKKLVNTLCECIDSWEREIRFTLRNTPHVMTILENQKKEMTDCLDSSIILLKFAFDNEVVRQAPDVENHSIMADIYTICFLCNYIMMSDKRYDEAIRKRTGLHYYSHRDKYINKVGNLCEKMMGDMIKGKCTIDFNGSKDKTGINNVELAWKKFDREICESEWLNKL